MKELLSALFFLFVWMVMSIFGGFLHSGMHTAQKEEKSHSSFERVYEQVSARITKKVDRATQAIGKAKEIYTREGEIE